MNTPNEEDSELRCAEYALGVLDANERREFERAAEADPAIAAMLARWQQRLGPLAEDLSPMNAPARVWTRIERELGFGSVQRAPVKAAFAKGWWNSLNLWRGLGIGASVAAVALVAVNVVLQREAARQASVAVAPANAYLVATLARADGVVHWTATVDVRRREMIVTPAAKAAVPAGRDTELWLIPPGAKPVALGVFRPDAAVRVTLPANIAASLDSRAALAVSIEPPGGSPTGQPTGPVVASGPMRGAT